MTFNPNLHHRRSIRLRDHDYSSGGYYFVTIYTHGHICYLGDIRDCAVSLSPVGETAHQYWEDIPNHFDNVDIDEFVIMPNHVHGIIIINDDTDGRGLINQTPTGNDKWILTKNTKQTLGKIIRHYKAKTSKTVHDAGYPGFTWQRNYHEHIIRNDADLDRIREYIKNNPYNWKDDENFI